MKIYEYDGRIYADEDISEKCSRYAGDMDDLLLALVRSGYLSESVSYWCAEREKVYEDPEEAVDEAIEHGVGEEKTLEEVTDLADDDLREIAESYNSLEEYRAHHEDDEEVLL